MILHEIICDICDDEIPSTLNQFNTLDMDEGTMFESEHYCEDCMSDNLSNCDGCYETHHVDDLNYHETSGYTYCDSCYPQYDFRELNGYHDAPELVPLGGTWECKLLGVEVEMEMVKHGMGRTEYISDVIDTVGETVFFQRDGSLSYGVELITMPMTLDYHMNKMDWSTVCEMAIKKGFRSHDTDTCGIHVHANRTSLGNSYEKRELVIAKLMIIIDKHWDDLVNFSRRNMSQLEQWSKKPSESFCESDTVEEIIQKSKDLEYDRYTALNIRNDKTIEFRMFRGTLKASTIMATIQLVDVLISYVQTHDLSDIFGATFGEIVASDFKELNNYLSERGI